MSRSYVLRFAVLASIWGSSFLFIKLALAGLSPVQIVLARLTAASVVLLAILAVRRQSLPRGKGVWGHLALMGVVANIVPFFLFGWGEQRIDSGLAGVLNGTTPLFTLAIAVAALPEERLSPSRAGGLILGFVGVLVVVAGSAGGLDAGNLLRSSLSGQLACLTAAAAYGVAFVYTRRFLSNRGHPPLALATAQLGAATLILAALAPVVARQPLDLTATVVGSVLALGAMGTGLAYLLFYGLLAEGGATTTSMVTYFIPIVAVILGIVVLGEPLTWNLFVGGAIVVLGVALAEGRFRRSRPSARTPAGVDTPVASSRRPVSQRRAGSNGGERPARPAGKGKIASGGP